MRRRDRSSRSRRISRFLVDIWEFLADNKKKVMPVILLVCVAVTILIAIHANKVTAERAISQADDRESGALMSINPEDARLEQNAYPEVNNLMSKYFEAYASGDVSILSGGLYRTMSEIDTVTVEERARYIDSIDNLTVYTKPGPVAGSFVVYAYTDVKYIGCEDYLPGIVSFYVCRADNGQYYINADDTTQSVMDYIKAVSLQDDVVELYNRVNVEYKEKTESDPMFAELVAAILAEIDESIGERLAGADEVLAAAQAASSATDASNEAVTDGDEPAQASTEEEAQPEPEPKEVKIRATTVVNVRSSDSTEAEVVGKTEVGAEYTRISELGNGWSKISFAGGAAYVKTEFFEVVGEDDNTGENAGPTQDGQQDGTEDATAENEQTAGQTAEQNTEQNAAETTAQDNANTQTTITSTGKKKVSTGVRIRKSASTEADILATLYGGAQVDVKTIRADGWSEVEYNGVKGYIKTEFLMDP